MIDKVRPVHSSAFKCNCLNSSSIILSLVVVFFFICLQEKMLDLDRSSDAERGASNVASCAIEII